MATNDNYTRTGKGGFTRWANRMSMVPVLGPVLTPVLGTLGTLGNTLEWAMKGKFLSAATALVAGAVSTVVNTAMSSFSFIGGFLPIIGINWATGIATGKSAGTHARKLTEEVIGGVTGLIGQKPTVLRSHQAGIGSIGGMGVNNQAMPQQPQAGYWANRVAQEQGRDPQQRWQQYVDESRRDAAIAGGRA